MFPNLEPCARHTNSGTPLTSYLKHGASVINNSSTGRSATGIPQVREVLTAPAATRDSRLSGTETILYHIAFHVRVLTFDVIFLRVGEKTFGIT